MKWITALICAAIFISNAWMQFGHATQMGQSKSDRTEEKRYSCRTIYGSFIYIMIIQILFSWLAISNETNLILLTVGFAVYIFGFWLRIYSMKILGRFFTFQIGIRKDHTIINEGPYKLIRHPSYTGYIVMTIGMSLVYASFWSFLALVPGTCFFLIVRIYDEEEMLLNHFGRPYADYIERTKRLVPFIY